MNKDLTVGKPSKVLWQFCLPLFASVIFQQLYNIADSLVCGRFIGENALAAVGNSYEVTLIFIAFSFGCNIGCSVIVSQLFGAKDYRGLRSAVSTTAIAAGVLCAVLMTLGLLFCQPLLTLIQTPAEILSDSALYLNIYLLGLPFLLFYNVATGIFSALGDSKTPFYFLAVSSTANILLDIVFVTVFSMGIAGVAWATFLCQGVSCLLAVTVVLRRLKTLPATEKPVLFSLPLFKKITAIAVPSILQQSFISVGNIIIQGVINGFGAGVIAGYAAAVKLNNLLITSLTTLGNGISNFTAQNLGAKQPIRVRQGLRAGLQLVWMICLPFALMYLLLGRPLLGLFLTEPSEAAVQTGIRFLQILSPFYFVVAAKLACDGVLRGSGAMKPFMIATFTDLSLRVLLAIVLAQTSLGATGIWLSWPIGWSIATAMSILFCRRLLSTQK